MRRVVRDVFFGQKQRGQVSDAETVAHGDAGTNIHTDTDALADTHRYADAYDDVDANPDADARWPDIHADTDAG